MTKAFPAYRDHKRVFGLITVLLFVLLFCAGLIAVFSYGQPWDEHVEVGILVSNIREFAARIGLEDRFVSCVGEYQVPKISEYIEKDHGMAAYYAFFPIGLAAGFRSSEIMYPWHIYTFILFFSGVAAVFLILKELFSRPLIWFGGMLSYYYTPRFFAEGHYNNKDIVFVSLMLWMLFFLIRAARTLSWKHLTLFSLFSGLMMNGKIAGIAIWAFCFFFLLLYRLLRNQGEKNVKKLAFAFFLSLLAYYALTPAAWDQPAEFLQYCLDNATHFSRWNRVVLFNGNMIRPAENGLPYSYLPKWILMTTPEHVLLLFAISCLAYGVGLVKRALRHLRRLPVPALSDRDFFAGMLLLLFWLPFIYLVLRSPGMVLYNGWRHCYFLYVPIILLFLYALEPDPGNRKAARVGSCLLSSVLIVGLISAASDLISFHPNEYVYFNRVSRNMFAMEDFEGDYWNISTIPALRHFEKTCYQGEELKVALMVDAGGGQTEALMNSDRLRIVDESEADYFLFNVSALNDPSVLNEYELKSGLEQDGYLISGVYIRKGR